MIGTCHRCTGGRLIAFYWPLGLIAAVLCQCDHCGWYGFPVDN